MTSLLNLSVLPLSQLCCLMMLLLGAAQVWAQGIVLVNDSLDQRPKGKDLTELLLWRGLTVPESGFTNALRTDTSGVSFIGTRLTDSAARYSQFTLSNGLKTNTAIDYKFNYQVDRLTDTLMVDFDLLHDAVARSGEGGRMVISLLHDYPQNGPQWLDVDSVNKYHPFGRPAYNVRIMSKDQTTNNNLAGVMLYGGGHVRKGEIEIFRRNNEAWWLTSFSTEAGGFSPGSNGEYPRSGSATIRNTGMTSGQRWAHFNWRIYPERLELWRRWSDQPEQASQLAITMHIPQVDTLNEAPTLARFNQLYGTNLGTLPRLYWWFRRVEAFRIYWAGGTNATVANLKITGYGPGIVTATAPVQQSSILTVWPSPATDQLSIRLSGHEDQTSTIRLINQLGQTVRTEVMTGNSHILECHDLPRGLYQLRVGTVVRRIVLG